MGYTCDLGSNVSSILDAATKIILIRGWACGTGWWNSDERYPVCAEGALEFALDLPHTPMNRPTLLAHPVYRFLQTFVGTNEPLHAWNDEEVCSQEEIITIFRAAAAAARKSEMAELEKELISA